MEAKKIHITTLTNTVYKDSRFAPKDLKRIKVKAELWNILQQM